MEEARDCLIGQEYDTFHAIMKNLTEKPSPKVPSPSSSQGKIVQSRKAYLSPVAELAAFLIDNRLMSSMGDVLVQEIKSNLTIL